MLRNGKFSLFRSRTSTKPSSDLTRISQRLVKRVEPSCVSLSRFHSFDALLSHFYSPQRHFQQFYPSRLSSRSPLRSSHSAERPTQRSSVEIDFSFRVSGSTRSCCFSHRCVFPLSPKSTPLTLYFVSTERVPPRDRDYVLQIPLVIVEDKG
jgi:hypothetical protein